MKKSKIFIPYFILCLMIATLSGCGSKEVHSEEVTQQTTTTTERPLIKETTTTTTTTTP